MFLPPRRQPQYQQARADMFVQAKEKDVYLPNLYGQHLMLLTSELTILLQQIGGVPPLSK